MDEEWDGGGVGMEQEWDGDGRGVRMVRGWNRFDEDGKGVEQE